MTLNFDLFSPKLVTWPWHYVEDGMATILFPLVGVALMLTTKYEVDMTTQYWVIGMCRKMCLVATVKKEKGSCVKLAICQDHPHLRGPLKFCMRGHSCPGDSYIYFKFPENQLRNLRAVGCRKSASPIDLANGLYNSLYYRTSRDMWNFVLSIDQFPNVFISAKP